MVLCIGTSRTEFAISKVLHRVLRFSSVACYEARLLVLLTHHWRESCLRYFELYGTYYALFGCTLGCSLEVKVLYYASKLDYNT